MENTDSKIVAKKKYMGFIVSKIDTGRINENGEPVYEYTAKNEKFTFKSENYWQVIENVECRVVEQHIKSTFKARQAGMRVIPVSTFVEQWETAYRQKSSIAFFCIDGKVNYNSRVNIEQLKRLALHPKTFSRFCKHKCILSLGNPVRIYVEHCKENGICMQGVMKSKAKVKEETGCDSVYTISDFLTKLYDGKIDLNGCGYFHNGMSDTHTDIAVMPLKPLSEIYGTYPYIVWYCK